MSKPLEERNENITNFAVKILEDAYKIAGKTLTSGDRKAIKKYTKNFCKCYQYIYIFGSNKRFMFDELFLRVNKIINPLRILHLDVKELEDWTNRYLTERVIVQENVDALGVVNKESHVMVLGQPGAGKTTFLKHVGLEVLLENVDIECLPVFISIKNWASTLHKDKTLIECIVYEFQLRGFYNAQEAVEILLSTGKLILLLDGLDEASGSDNFQEIQTTLIDFADQYGQNRFILSCRMATYTQYFERFTNIELAEFSENQSITFIKKWFGTRAEQKANKCIKELGKRDNAPIKELAKSPLFASLICLAFDFSPTFPPRRAELYKDALRALLRGDAQRNINRGKNIYEHLTVGRKEDLFSMLAFVWFINKQYLIKQENVEDLITEFVYSLSEVREKKLIPDSTRILKDIETKHGILVQRTHSVYSFSHLSLQEYYTARYIKEDLTVLPTVMEHMFSPRWREVFVLLAEMLSNAQYLFVLMQERLNEILKGHANVKRLIEWAIIEASKHKKEEEEIAYRAFYIARALFVARAFDILNQARNLQHDMAIAGAVTATTKLANALGLSIDHAREFGLTEMLRELRELERAHPIIRNTPAWLEWTEELYSLTKQYKEEGQDFELDSQSIEILTKYIYGTNLLFTCLKGSCIVRDDLRYNLLNNLLRV